MVVLAFTTILDERDQIKSCIEKTKIFTAGATDSTSSHATDKEPSWDWLIEIQFTRPCSFECLSGCIGLVTLQTHKCLIFQGRATLMLVTGKSSLQGHLEEVQRVGWGKPTM